MHVALKKSRKRFVLLFNILWLATVDTTCQLLTPRQSMLANHRLGKKKLDQLRKKTYRR